MATKKKTTKRRTNKPISKKKAVKNKTYEPDSAFFLKSVVFLILGTQWIYLESGNEWQIPIPIGLMVGLVFATHEHFQIDRKIEYVILLFATYILTTVSFLCYSVSQSLNSWRIGKSKCE
jgi:hypothetical protein